LIKNRTVLGGWQVNGIFAGNQVCPLPLPPMAQPPILAHPPAGPTWFPEYLHTLRTSPVAEWFNPAAFSVPTAYNWGNSGRNILRGPDEINLDSSAEKKFPITEGATLLFRLELFNMFNHPQFQIPASVIATGGVGSITTTSNTARQMQFTLRLTF
jgi:hypothetical protein